jgi:hypothetical protein
MSKGHDDLGAAGSLAEKAGDLGDERRAWILDRRRKTLRVEKHHTRPADRPAPAIGRRQDHHEEISFVIEEVLLILEFGQRLLADGFQEIQMFLASLQGLFHRDHAVSKHAGLRHGKGRRSRDVGGALRPSSYVLPPLLFIGRSPVRSP